MQAEDGSFSWIPANQLDVIYSGVSNSDGSWTISSPLDCGDHLFTWSTRYYWNETESTWGPATNSQQEQRVPHRENLHDTK